MYLCIDGLMQVFQENKKSYLLARIHRCVFFGVRVCCTCFVVLFVVVVGEFHFLGVADSIQHKLGIHILSDLFCECLRNGSGIESRAVSPRTDGVDTPTILVWTLFVAREFTQSGVEPIVLRNKRM